jgi:hypothetical protein
VVALRPRRAGHERPARDSIAGARDTKAGIRLLVVGSVVVLAAQVAAPLSGPPLYDGLPTVEAYRWLSPPPGEKGGAQGVSSVLPVSGDSSPVVILATTEVTPQAQVFAPPGALTMPPGTSSLTVSITPLAPSAQPTDGHIAGNVYRITITTQAGEPVSAPAGTDVTVILRHPDITATDATISLLTNGAWQPFKTDAGLAASFVAVVTTFGDFALISPGPGPTGVGPVATATVAASATAAVPTAVATPTGTGSVPPSEPGIPTVTIVAGVATVLVLLALVALALLPRRSRGGEWTDRRDRPGRR